MDTFRVDIDTAPLLQALDRLSGVVVERYTKPACRVTADRIQAAARARVPRGRTGRLAAGITVDESYDKQGYVVLPFNADLELALIASGNDQQPENLPVWMEFGTRKMHARPYFFAAARLEEAGHDRRIRQAVQDAIDDVGLGEG